jgi:cytochrome c-type biogenesis protein CcmF
MTESGLDSTLVRDVYIIISERSGDKWIFRAFVIPLVQFIWLGTIIILAGLGLTLSSRRRKVKQEAIDHSSLAHAK